MKRKNAASFNNCNMNSSSCNSISRNCRRVVRMTVMIPPPATRASNSYAYGAGMPVADAILAISPRYHIAARARAAVRVAPSIFRGLTDNRMISCTSIDGGRSSTNKSSLIIVASWNKGLKYAITLASLLAAVGGRAWADGVSAYLPLNLEPEMERQIERVLILADEPILKRPIPVELVKLALPQACKIDKPLCTKVQRYLERYSHDYAVTHASVTGSLTHGADGV